MELFWTIILFLIILSILVLVHEWGHFAAARFFKVKVEEFGIGFPPKAFGIKRGETEYTVNWLPLGGFVRLKGEQGEQACDPDSFAAKPIWQRLIILAAGVGMNLVLAIVVFSLGFMLGMPQVIDDTTGGNVQDRYIQITNTLSDSPAKKAGFKQGDIMLALDGVHIESIQKLQLFMKEHEGKNVLVHIKRGEEEKDIAVVPEVLINRGTVGIGIELAQTGIVSYPIHLAIWKGIESTFFVAIMIFVSLWNAIARLAFEGFVGPVGIAAYTATVSKLGFTYLLNLVAQLSVSLAVINFLPIPALDGGRAFLVIVEKCRRKSFNPSFEQTFHMIGFFFLIILLIVITWRDIIRLLQS